MSTLPDKVGDLIRLAVKDLTLCEADPQYLVDMGVWHSYDDVDDLCLVCLAGSVMAHSLEVDRTLERSPSGFDEGVEHKLSVLNFCRYFSEGPEDPRYGINQQVFANYDKLLASGELFDITPYPIGPVQFKTDMLALADLMDRYDVHYIGA